MEIGNLPEKEFRIIIVNKIQDLQKRMETKFEKMQEIFTKDLQELNLVEVMAFQWSCFKS